jgi:integrase
MAAKQQRRRSRGEGSVGSYQTKAGQRWYWKATITQPDGSKKVVWKRGYLVKSTPRDKTEPVGALDAMRAALTDASRGTYSEPSKRTLGSWLDEWVAGLRLAPSSVASYRKNVRLHIKPYLGSVPLASLTGPRITALYRQLEAGGRADHKAGTGLSARTVKYVHAILHSALGAAVDAGLLARNPADKAVPPTAREARPPEMHPWSQEQLGAFLGWSAEHSSLHTAWALLASTGMRRGELLALRWRDVDLARSTVTVRRSVGVVRNAGEGETVTEGSTKTGRPRVIDISDGDVALLRSWRRERGSLALALARDDALVFSDLEGRHLHPARFSLRFQNTLRDCRKALGDAAPPVIRLHDLRHTMATHWLASGVPVKVVSERLGHTSAVITMNVYQHVLPGMQRGWAERLAMGAQVAGKLHGAGEAR